MSHKTDYKKGIPDLLGTNLAYLLRLDQLSVHEDLPPIWKDISGDPKYQQLTTLQRALDDTARRLSKCAHIVVTLVLIKLTLVLGFCLDH